MAGKRISIFICSSPHYSFKASEALRMAVGMTLVHEEVWVLAMGDGVEIVEGLEGDWEEAEGFRRHIGAFLQLGLPVVLEEESLDERRTASMPSEVSLWPRQKILQSLEDFDFTVIVRD